MDETLNGASQGISGIGTGNHARSGELSARLNEAPDVSRPIEMGRGKPSGRTFGGR